MSATIVWQVGRNGVFEFLFGSQLLVSGGFSSSSKTAVEKTNVGTEVRTVECDKVVGWYDGTTDGEKIEKISATGAQQQRAP